MMNMYLWIWQRQMLAMCAQLMPHVHNIMCRCSIVPHTSSVRNMQRFYRTLHIFNQDCAHSTRCFPCTTQGSRSSLGLALMGRGSYSSPTKALAKRVKPMAKGAVLPCPGLLMAVAYTTDTSVKVMHISQPKSCQLSTIGMWVGVKQPGPLLPWPTCTPGMISDCGTRIQEMRLLRYLLCVLVTKLIFSTLMGSNLCLRSNYRAHGFIY